MPKVLAVAWAEFMVAVRSKAFLAGVLSLPLIWGAAILIPQLLEDKVDTAPRKLAVVDPAGEVHDLLAAASAERDERVVFEGEGGERRQLAPRFVVERHEPGDEDWRLALSDRVREGELFAFVAVGPNLVAGGEDAELEYYTQTPTYDDLPDWIRNTVNGFVQGRRIEEAGLEPAQVARLTERVPFDVLGLASVAKDTGEVIAAERHRSSDVAVPLGAAFLIFMLVMTVAPAGLNNVLEEKMQKISEVLVSAVSPFQLMLGKLLGTVFVAGVLSVLYVSVILGVLEYHGWSDVVRPSMFAWFAFFQLMALVIFGALFSAIGAACSEMRDAQSFMLPAMMLAMIPMFFIEATISDPNGAIATGASLFPPATPFLMLIRIGLSPGPPMWQVALGVALTLLFSLFAVWAGGKIFRVGLLSQGQAPSLARLAKWVFAK